jgi:oleate hydratase
MVKFTNMNLESGDQKAYFIGGGIASLAGAVYLIQDGGFSGENIVVFESKNSVGGSLDAQKNSSEETHAMTGHRILAENAFECTYDLFSRVPSLKNEEVSIKEEVDEFNERVKTYAKARLMQDGKIIDSHALNLSWKHRRKIFTLFIRNESTLDNLRIDEYFEPEFFDTNFFLIL